MKFLYKSQTDWLRTWRIVTTTLCDFDIMTKMTTTSTAMCKRERVSMRENGRTFKLVSITWVQLQQKTKKKLNEYISASKKCFFSFLSFGSDSFLRWSLYLAIVNHHNWIYDSIDFYGSVPVGFVLAVPIRVLLLHRCEFNCAFFFWFVVQCAWFAEWLNDQTLQFHKIKVSK